MSRYSTVFALVMDLVLSACAAEPTRPPVEVAAADVELETAMDINAFPTITT